MKINPSVLTRLMAMLLLAGISLALVACSEAAPPEEAEVVAEVTEEEPQEAEPPTATPEPPTATPEPPTETPEPPTETPEPPTATPEPPTDTPEPPTETPTPADTPTPELPTDTPTPEPPANTPTPAIDPVDERFDQALAYYDQEQWPEAIAEFQAVIDLDPTYSPAYVGLGYSYAFNEELTPAIEALQKYLELEPAAEDRAQVEEDIATLQKILAERGGQEFDIPPGKALFVFKNYSGEQWNVDIGSYFLEVPPNPPDREFTYTTLAIDPGTYTWQAHSADAGNYIVDSDGNSGFEFTVAAGEIYGTQCCR